MELIADILLAAGAAGAGLYCLVLSRRLARFNDLEAGMGGAVAMLAVQVEDLKKALDQAGSGAAEKAAHLEDVIARADRIRWELDGATQLNLCDRGEERTRRVRRRQRPSNDIGDAA